MLKLAFAQLNYTVGDFVGNGDAIIDHVARAAQEGADIVVFSELSLCGYYPADLLEDMAFLHKMDLTLERVKKATRNTPNLVVVIGAARGSRSVGNALHNALLVLKNGKIVAEYHKQLLSTHGVFDERRHFEPGPEKACLLEVKNCKIGFLICEDSWNEQGADYKVNPYKALRAAKPDLVISINASPSDLGKRSQRHTLFTAATMHTRLPQLYVNQIGGQDQLVYDGASFAVSPSQGIAFEAPRFVEHFQLIGFEAGKFVAGDGAALPVPDKDGLSAEEFARRQIVLGLRDYARRCGFGRVVVGVSGGIDSALTLTLAAQAMGAENVFALAMPSPFSSEASVADAVALCNNLGVKLYMHPIHDVLEKYGQGFQAAFEATLYGVPLENLQARIRGTILMEFSNAFGALLLATGNKSEISVGYCTLYGDTNGGLGLIGDLYKTEVFSLARYLNEQAGRELIPSAIFSKAPSAELAPGQKDTDILPPYEILDEILKWHIEGVRLPGEQWRAACLFVQHLVRTDAGKKTVADILKMVARNEYKRRQAPPLIRLRARAFGSGRQMPIAAHYQ